MIICARATSFDSCDSARSHFYGAEFVIVDQRPFKFDLADIGSIAFLRAHVLVILLLAGGLLAHLERTMLLLRANLVLLLLVD